MHIFCAGMTLHGKSFLVKRMIKQFLKSRQYKGALVCDPNEFPRQEYHAAYTTPDPLQLLAVAQRNKNCLLIHEECADTMPAGSAIAGQCKYFATRCRHQGHRSIFIGTTPQLIDRRFRSQCTRGYIFKLAPLDAEYCSRMLGYKEYLQLQDLEPYQFMTYEPGKVPRICQLDAR